MPAAALRYKWQYRLPIVVVFFSSPPLHTLSAKPKFKPARDYLQHLAPTARPPNALSLSRGLFPCPTGESGLAHSTTANTGTISPLTKDAAKPGDLDFPIGRALMRGRLTCHTGIVRKHGAPRHPGEHIVTYDKWSLQGHGCKCCGGHGPFHLGTPHSPLRLPLEDARGVFLHFPQRVLVRSPRSAVGAGMGSAAGKGSRKRHLAAGEFQVCVRVVYYL